MRYNVSTDAGVTWQRRGRTPPPLAITASAADGIWVLVVTGENVLDSADGGNHIHTAADPRTVAPAGRPAARPVDAALVTEFGSLRTNPAYPLGVWTWCGSRVKSFGKFAALRGLDLPVAQCASLLRRRCG